MIWFLPCLILDGVVGLSLLAVGFSWAGCFVGLDPVERHFRKRDRFDEFQPVLVVIGSMENRRTRSLLNRTPLPVLLSALLLVACDRGGSVTSKYPQTTEREIKGAARTSLDSPNPSAAQLARRARSLKVLKSLKIPYFEGLPVVEDASAIQPRTKEEVASRCLAIMVCAIKGETKDHGLVRDYIGRWRVSAVLSPKEQRFIDDPNPTQQQMVDFTWQYEDAHVLLWSLGLVPDLAPPNESCDVHALAQIVKETDSRDLAARRACVRSMRSSTRRTCTTTCIGLRSSYA